MAITLTVASTTVTLHPDLFWSDEFAWFPVAQTVEQTLTGAIVVDASQKLTGRPITLKPIDDSSAWMTRAVIDQLRVWADTPLQSMTLSLRGVTYTVVWAHQEPPALAATPLLHYSDVVSGDWYLATLKFTVTS